jgi:hypothetical protein
VKTPFILRTLFCLCATFKAFKIDPFPLSVMDVLTSLQTGLINGVYISPYAATGKAARQSLVASISIDKLFAAGLVPGVLLVGILTAYSIRKGKQINLPNQLGSTRCIWVSSS